MQVTVLPSKPEVAPGMAIGVGVGRQAEALGRITRRGVAATIWRREPPARLLERLAALPGEALPQIRREFTGAEGEGAVRDAVRDAAAEADRLDPGIGAALAEDVAALALRFRAVMGAEQVALRLTPIDGNACRRFHLDQVTARLITTYRGPGTEYGLDPREPGAEPRQVHTVPTGAVAMFRGSLWPDRDISGILHRSPPIAGTGQHRLILVVDPVRKPLD